MKLAHIVLGSVLLPASVALVGCSADPSGDDPAGAGSSGIGSAGRAGSSGSGNNPSGGSGNNPSAGSGNSPSAGSGGAPSGGAGSGPGGGAGSNASGGAGNGGAGGRASGGSGGKASGGAGGKASGGAGGGGGTSGAAGAPALDCSTPMPTGGTTVTSKDKTGKAAGLDWAIWSNGTTAGSITTFTTPAFSAKWRDSSDFLARLGLQWNATKTFEELGTVTAQFAVKRGGTAGPYSYIGVYGWSISPCIEWYIIDQSWGTMPVTPGGTTVATTATEIDGAKYRLVKRNTTGTGGSKCPGTSTWDQYYSIRMTGRDCGQISVTEHFKVWAANQMPLGKMDQAQILLEAGGGEGSADFSVANVTLTPP